MLPGLRAAGHKVHALTLTGDGERAHLRHTGITLRTHIADVVGLVDAEELHDVVLAGHCGAGQVITGAADALAAGRVKRLRYVDAVGLLPGEGWGSQHPPEVVAERRAAAAVNGNALPPPEPAGLGLSGPDRNGLLRRQVPHPFGPNRGTMPFGAGRRHALPRAFIDSTSPAYPTIAAARRRVRHPGSCPSRSVPPTREAADRSMPGKAFGLAKNRRLRPST